MASAVSGTGPAPPPDLPLALPDVLNMDMDLEQLELDLETGLCFCPRLLHRTSTTNRDTLTYNISSECKCYSRICYNSCKSNSLQQTDFRDTLFEHCKYSYASNVILELEVAPRNELFLDLGSCHVFVFIECFDYSNVNIKMIKNGRIGNGRYQSYIEIKKTISNSTLQALEHIRDVIVNCIRLVEFITLDLLETGTEILLNTVRICINYFT